MADYKHFISETKSLSLGHYFQTTFQLFWKNLT